MPTLLDVAGVAPLDAVNGRRAKPMDGASFSTVLRDPNAPCPRDEQYYECWSNRAYYRDGWLARSLQVRGEPIDMDNWTLHDLANDFSECEDLRARHPERLADLVAAFDEAAWENLVYPLDNRDRFEKFADASPQARQLADQPRTYFPGTQSVHRHDVFPLIDDRSYHVTVRLDSLTATKACSGHSATPSAAWCSTSKTAARIFTTTASASGTRSSRCACRRATTRSDWNTKHSALAGGAGGCGSTRPRRRTGLISRRP